MENKIYYLPNDEIWNSFFGSQNPVCVDQAEVERLAREWDDEDLMDKMHEASDSDIEDYGCYNS